MARNRELSEDEIRRLFVSDEDWERVHPTWKALKPRKNFNEFRESDESSDEYAMRIGARFGFPEPVLTQWMYGLYYQSNTIQNYAWIDFDQVVFTKERWETSRLVGLRVIDEFRPYVEERAAAFSSPQEFFCVALDKEAWIDRGTWRVPPIAIDGDGLGDPPKQSDIVGRFQLVEGHTRMGYLRALARAGHSALAAEHDVFVLRAKK